MLSFIKVKGHKFSFPDNPGLSTPKVDLASCHGCEAVSTDAPRRDGSELNSCFSPQSKEKQDADSKLNRPLLSPGDC